MNLTYNSFTRKIPLIFNILGGILLSLAAVSVMFFPNTEIFFKTAFPLYAAIYFPTLIWLGEKRPATPVQIILSVLSLTPWLTFFFEETPPKVLIETLIFLVSFAVVLLLFIKKGYTFGLFVTSLYYLMQVLLYSERILLLDSWLIILLALIDGIAAVAFYAIMKKRQLCFKKIQGTAKNIFVAGLAFFVFFFISVGVNKALNYSLDANSPELIYATVEDRTESKSVFSNTEYYLTVYLNDKSVEIEVTEDEYNFYSPGDIFTVVIRKGAYGQSFYISGTWKQNNVLNEPALENT